MTQAQATDYFQGYARAFEAYDIDAITDHMNVPLTIVEPDRTTALVTRDQVIANFSGMNERHAGLGFAHAELVACGITPTAADNVVNATTTWRFEKEDGEVIYSFDMAYVLCDYGKGWKITVAVNADD